MVAALIGMGSNISPEKHLADAAVEIRIAFPYVRFSSVYRSKAVGMQGDDFLNACCLIESGLIESDLTQQALVNQLKSLEDKHGRDRSEGSFKPRTLDLDLLLFDGKLLDDDLYRYPHVYVPASELVDSRYDSQWPTPENGVVKKVELRL